ncbi:hypothetical protein, partial [Escherichia coli]|uniref:hypothetical protein n=1 Tax=Escherichia coli TaxID=562 RepID=UPI001953711A
ELIGFPVRECDEVQGRIVRCAFFIAFSDHFMCVYRHLWADNHPVFLSKYVLTRGGHHVLCCAS